MADAPLLDDELNNDKTDLASEDPAPVSVDDSADEPEDESTEEPSPDSLMGRLASAMPKSDLHLQKQEGRKGWYVIHTYAGYEDQVADSLRQRTDSFGMQDKIFSVVVPKEKQIEIKNGKRRTVEKRIFPGYVMVEMIVTDDSWYVVRNTPNVTGFIGLGVQPTPIDQAEVARIQKRMGVEEPKYKIELKIDEPVKIIDGPLKGFEGKVTDVDDDRGKIKVSVSMFGRETPVTLDFLQIKKI